VNNHYHILQLPKEYSDEESNKVIDDFLTGIVNELFPNEKLDTQVLFCYKTLMFLHLEHLTTNNYHNFVLDEKILDKLI
jgi:hypothetical protein